MAQFDDLVTVVRHMTNRTMHAGTKSGDLYIDTPEKLDALRACEAKQDDTALTLLNPNSIDLVAVGSTVQIEIAHPRPGFGLLSENVDALLHFPSTHVKEPIHYYLLDTDSGHGDSLPPNHILEAYRAVLNFVSMLKSCAAFLDEQEELLVFIKEGKFEVPVKFTEADLRSVNRETLAALSSVLSDGPHEQQRASIMAEAVYEITAKFPTYNRFATLLEQAKELKERFDDGYKLFAAGFSYDKIRDEIETARVEYSGKIHKVFSDIQNQLLGIPVATIIVATQMKESTKIDDNFLTNVAVLIGSFVFMLLMNFLLHNQQQTLEVIGIEINRQKMKLEKEHAAIAENFTETFRSLDKRFKTQKKLLWIIDGVVVAGFILSLFFFYIFSQPVQSWFIALLKCQPA